MTRYFLFLSFLVLPSVAGAADVSPSPEPARPGIPGVQAKIGDLKIANVFELGGFPDWMILTEGSVWISNSPKNLVNRIDPATNRITDTTTVKGKPCSNLAAGFGSLWVPICGDSPALARIDLKTAEITDTLPFAPGEPEGCIATSPDSVWMVTDKLGTLLRLDPQTNRVRAKIHLPAESFNPLYADGLVWVTSSKTSELVAVDPAVDMVVATIPVGPQPHFLTAGAGSVWTLNQGDGSVTRVDTRTRKMLATITAGIPGKGGKICYGFGAVWATVFQIPLTRIDAAADRVTDQWTGVGGDSVRCGFGAIWLTSGRAGLLWRVPVNDIKRP